MSIPTSTKAHPPPELLEVEQRIEDVREWKEQEMREAALAEADRRREQAEREARQQEIIPRLPPLEWQKGIEVAHAHHDGMSEHEWLAKDEHMALASKPPVHDAPGDDAANRLAQLVYNLREAGLWPWVGEHSHDIHNYDSLTNLARKVGVTRETLRLAVKQGQIPAVRIGSQFLIHKSMIPFIQARQLNKYNPYKGAMLEALAKRRAEATQAEAQEGDDGEATE